VPSCPLAVQSIEKAADSRIRFGGHVRLFLIANEKPAVPKRQVHAW
jgi:hypothetical protein